MNDQPAMAPMSAPAANAFSLPVMIMQPIAGSASNDFSAAPSSSINWLLRALSCLGRLRVTMPTLPASVRTSMSSYAMAFLLEVAREL